MAMQDIELMIAHNFVHAHRKREVVRRVLKEGIAPDIHLVEPHPRQEAGQPERLLIGDEMHFVTTGGEGDAQFRGDSARSAVGGITSNADFHAVLVWLKRFTPAVSSSHHASASSNALGALGSSDVTCAAGS